MGERAMGSEDLSTGVRRDTINGECDALTIYMTL